MPYYMGKYYSPDDPRLEEWKEMRARREGNVFGETTARRLGLPSRYPYEGREEWFEKLRAYSAYMYNYPQLAKTYPTWVRGAQWGLTPQEYFKRAYDIYRTGRAMTPDELYIFGYSDQPAPEAQRSIPPGITPTMIGGGEREESPAQSWFKQQYPSFSERGGARPTARGWRDIFTGSARFAPRIKTVGF